VDDYRLKQAAKRSDEKSKRFHERIYREPVNIVMTPIRQVTTANSR